MTAFRPAGAFSSIRVIIQFSILVTYFSKLSKRTTMVSL